MSFKLFTKKTSTGNVWEGGKQPSPDEKEADIPESARKEKQKPHLKSISNDSSYNSRYDDDNVPDTPVTRDEATPKGRVVIGGTASIQVDTPMRPPVIPAPLEDNSFTVETPESTRMVKQSSLAKLTTNKDSKVVVRGPEKIVLDLKNVKLGSSPKTGIDSRSADGSFTHSSRLSEVLYANDVDVPRRLPSDKHNDKSLENSIPELSSASGSANQLADERLVL